MQKKIEAGTSWRPATVATTALANVGKWLCRTTNMGIKIRKKIIALCLVILSQSYLEYL